MVETNRSNHSRAQSQGAQSNEQFGLPIVGPNLFDESTPAVLKNWTARDFASIYIKFRPHLERHARRFLNESWQIEEVVQDAFLYLMTSLPELDSEVGVLRFLKWKVRLLCLDTIRASSRSREVSLEASTDLEDNDYSPSEVLTRADESAIVTLALSKLEPRHREALIATVYEERSHSEAASQMGLNENAFRQLLYRARKSFKISLVGSAQVNGKSISEVLSIAARHASRGSKVASSIVLVFGVAIAATAWAPLSSETFENVAIQNSPLSEFEFPTPGSQKFDGSVQGEKAEPSKEFVQEPGSTDGAAFEASAATELVMEIGTLPGVGESSVAVDSGQSEAEVPSRLQSAAFEWASVLLTDLTRAQVSQEHVLSSDRLIISLGQATSLSILLDQTADRHFSSAVLSGSGAFDGLIAIPTMTHEVTHVTADAQTMVSAVLTGFAVADLSGALGDDVLEDAHFQDVAILLTLTFSDESRVNLTSYSAEFIPRA